MKKTFEVVDMFCGAGGESTGIMQAAMEQDMNVNLLAINHWERAMGTHAANHSSALVIILKHLKGFDDIYQQDNVTVVKFKPDGTRKLKVTHLNVTRNGKNYDMQFCQKINTVYCPSSKTHKKPRMEILEEIKDVPLTEIISQFNWVIEGKKKVCVLGHAIDYSVSTQDRPCWGCKQGKECSEKYMEVEIEM